MRCKHAERIFVNVGDRFALGRYGHRSDGTEFPVEISLSPIQHASDRLVVAGIRDVTDRRNIEREAQRANAYLVSAVDAIQDAFALYDEDDRVVLVNSSCRQLLGRALGGAIIGRTFAELLPDALAAGVFDFSEESRDQLLERWLAYHRAPAGTLDVRTGPGRYLRVYLTKPVKVAELTAVLEELLVDRDP